MHWSPDAPPLAYHVCLRPADQRVILPDVASRRTAARVIMEQGEERGLLYFAAVDTHAHATVATHRDAAGRFAHDVETSLRWRLKIETPFEPASIRPVRTQWHLTNGLWYTLDQDRRHGVDRDRAHDGTFLLDVLGGRVMLDSTGPGRSRRLCPDLGARLSSALPRLHGRDLLGRIGGPEMLAVEPDLEPLADAAAAAVGLPRLEGRGVVACVALRGAVHASIVHPVAAVADALHVTARAVQRLRREEPDPPVTRAVGIQWRLRSHLRALDAGGLDTILLAPGTVDAHAVPGGK